jgi:CBS domain-containing protein
VAVVRDTAVIGVVSERDILGMTLRVGKEATSVPVWKVMSVPPVVTSPDESARTAGLRMFANRLGCLPVVEHGRLVGMLGAADLLRGDAERPLTEALPRLDAIMSTRPIAVTPGTELAEAAALMARHAVRHLPVIDPAGRVLGIVSDRDVRTALGEADEDPERARGLTVAHAMTHDVVTVSRLASVEEVAALLVERRIGAVPVVDEGGALAGMVSYTDVLGALARGPRTAKGVEHVSIDAP